jgi:hypothetical protein
MRNDWLLAAGIAFAGISGLAGNAWSQEHPGHQPHSHNWLSGTYLDPAIQRHDLFPRVITSHIPEFREVYNRPRYPTGKFLYHIEPSSQEAMAWETNVRNGNYRNHRGAYIPGYYYPKPWEALNTMPRQGFRKTSGLTPAGLESGPVMEAVSPAIP